MAKIKAVANGGGVWTITDESPGSRRYVSGDELVSEIMNNQAKITEALSGIVNIIQAMRGADSDGF